MRQGEAFKCAHSQESAGGCGHGRFCQICPIREAATLAWKEQRVVRRRTKADVGQPGRRGEADLLVTATPLPYEGATRILLVLEDISGLVALLDPTPVCAACQRVRNDDRYWEKMEAHFLQHLDVDLSHGVCPDCRQKLFGNLPSR